MASSHWDTLKLLKARAGEYLAGPLLAYELKVSRTAVWKHIQKLNALGYGIVSHPRKGYRLSETPDLIVPEEVRPRLETVRMGKPYHYFPQVGSTNDEALELAARGAPHGSLVAADEQTQGKGRLQRRWMSPPGRGLYMSLVLRPSRPVNEAPRITLVSALSLTQILREHYGLPASVKWPNDVLIDGKKICGILTEMQSDQDRIRFLVMGIGINVSHSRQELGGPLRYPATSLRIESGRSVGRQELMAAFLKRFEEDYEALMQKGFAGLLKELEAVSGIIGKRIRVQCGNEVFEGRVAGFTPEGALRLETAKEGETVIWVGDVTQVEGARR